jgi:hypothetical protein
MILRKCRRLFSWAVVLSVTLLQGLLSVTAFCANADAKSEREISPSAVGKEPVRFKGEVTAAGSFTWWLPAGADAVVLPIADGVVVETTNAPVMQWLRKNSPWELVQLPLAGLRYGDRTLVVIVPFPQYAELVVGDRVGVKFAWPKDRGDAAVPEVVAFWRGADPLEVARGFREWRQAGRDQGSIPRPKTLQEKAAELPHVSWLYGAPHIYLWGPVLFSRHDVETSKWKACAKWMRSAPAESPAGRIVSRFSKENRKSLGELADSEWPLPYLTTGVVAGLEQALQDPALIPVSSNLPPSVVIQSNRQYVAAALKEFVNDPATWGDGVSIPMLENLHRSGIDHAVLLLSDLHAKSPRPDVARRATELGFLLGPYDEYHTVHSPDAGPNETWETSQFDRAAFEKGRILDADGKGNKGFRGTGFHFSPAAAWPYVEKRVRSVLEQVPYTAWFMDCDATGEWFDDYNPLHPASRVDDMNLRRQRLRWLGKDEKLVVGSEGGTVLLSDVVVFGHGVHTPYIGHLDPAFRDKSSPHYLGGYWPSDSPDGYFKPVPVAPAMVTPYFDPRYRLPLYEAALGDEMIVTHHWSFDSLKFSDISATRELLEILYMVPPMYHLNRETWPKRREQILRHLAFWTPLHRVLAAARLSGFEYVGNNRKVQRTTFHTEAGTVTITVNFTGNEVAGFPGQSATVAGDAHFPQAVYRAGAK